MLFKKNRMLDIKAKISTHKKVIYFLKIIHKILINYFL